MAPFDESSKRWSSEPDEGRKDIDEEDTGEFQFCPSLQPDEGDRDHQDLTETEQKRIVDIVRFEPTGNSQLENRWGLESGSEVHQYLESHLSAYYYRDSESYIRATEEAKDFVDEHQALYQDVTKEPGRREEATPNIINRDLLMELVAVTQRLGHLPSPEEVDENAEYAAQQYRDEFGSLFEAYKEAGVLPDSASRSEYSELLESNAEERNEDTKDETATETSNGEEPSRDELIDELQRLYSQLEGLPLPSEMNEKGKFATKAYYSEFGSWDESLEAASIDKKEEVFLEIARVVEKIGGLPTYDEMGEYGKFSASIVSKYLDGWSDAKAEFEEWYKKQDAAGEAQTEAPDESSNDVPTREDLLVELKRIDQEIDRLPYPADVNQESSYSADLYQERFDWWYAALEAADLVDEDTFLEEMKQVAEQVEGIPSRSEMNEHGQYSATMISNHFGGWDEAIDQLNDRLDVVDLEPDDEEEPKKDVDEIDGPTEHEEETSQQNPPQEAEEDGLGAEEQTHGDLLAELRSVTTKLGRLPKPHEFREHGDFPLREYTEAFGSWTEALEAAALEPEDRLINELRTIEQKTDSVPTTGDVKKLGKYPLSWYRDYFGSWYDTLAAAGFDQPTKEDLINEIQQIEAEIGRVPTKTEIEQNSEYSSQSFLIVFDSFRDAVSNAGLSYRSAILESIRDVTRELGERPSTVDFDNHSPYNIGIVYKEFNSWDEALTAAGVTNTGEIQPAEEVSGVESTPETKPSPLAEYYQSFENLLAVQDALSCVEIHTTDEKAPMQEWYDRISARVHGPPPDDWSTGYSTQVASATDLDFDKYVDIYGDGSRVQEFECTQVQSIPDSIKQLLEIITEDETRLDYQLPCAPDSGTPLPVIVESDAELDRATGLLEEFPSAPPTIVSEVAEDEASASPESEESIPTTTVSTHQSPDEKTPITEVRGVSTSVAQALQEAGYEWEQDLRKATDSELASVEGLTKQQVQLIRAAVGRASSKE